MVSFKEILDESIILELNISELYFVFHKKFAEDKDFWWTLVLEEKNHASLLRSGEKHFVPVGKFPQEILADTVEILKATNKSIKYLIEKFEKSDSSRKEAFETAYKLEKSAGELHFQEFMDTNSSEPIQKLFNQLNKDDKNHAKRILGYMEENNI